MKKIVLFFCLLISTYSGFSQSRAADSALLRIVAEKNDSVKLNLLYTCFLVSSDTNPLGDMARAQWLLLQSQKDNDKVAAAFAMDIIGYNYRTLGENVKSSDYTLKALKIANETGNERLIAKATFFLGHVYRGEKDYPKAIREYKKAATVLEKINDYNQLRLTYEVLGQAYIYDNKIDSALFYAQRDYELCTKFHITVFLAYTFGVIADIQAKLGNPSLAFSYYNMAITEALKAKSAKQLSFVYAHLAQYYYYNIHQADSSIFYAKKAFAAIENTSMSNSNMNVAKLLADIYRHSNADSALKYTDIYVAAKDSLYGEKIIQQTQAMTFENELHQQEVTNEKAQADEQRKENIQYAFIAFGIVVFIMIFLLLSRSIITNTRIIQLLSVMALLIVFEFLNLLLHPFMERITHHTPILMLLGLVCIAAVLVPLHHRIEKWATNKLVEKNKEIRLTAAKKTIEKLEKDKPNT